LRAKGFFVTSCSAACKGSSAEQDYKAFLNQVVIVRKDLGDPLPAHGSHRHAVDQAVTLVGALLI
jgi:hypothetical protein